MPNIKRNLPVLSKVELRNFTIYQNHRNLTVPVKSGVFCLAGANGMGKSSFLAAVNYGLTGVTPDPRRSFNGVEKFYSDGTAFAYKYFDGRVSQDDRSEAAVSLDFRVGDHKYSITRGFFETEELRSVTVTDLQGYVVLDGRDRTGKQRQAAYAARIVEDCHVANFEYFVFLQHYLLSFDERRNLLFWDTRAANVALYLAFGVDPEDTQRSEDLSECLINGRAGSGDMP
jgi:DNA repair exonuclease SbcCD ATPase subunit